jgi:hypothetical protein
VPKHDFVERAFADHTPPRRSPPHRISHEQPSPEHLVSERIASEHIAPKRVPPKHPAPKQVRSHKVAPHQASLQQAPSRQASTQQVSRPQARAVRAPVRQAAPRKAPSRSFSAKGVGAGAFVGVALAFFGFAIVYQSDADANVSGVETAAVTEAPRADKVAGSYAAVLDPGYSLGAKPSTFQPSTASGAAPRGARLQLASLTVPDAPPVAAPVEPMLAQPQAAEAPLPLPRPETPSAAVASVPLPMPRPAAASAVAANGPTPAEVAQPNKSVALAKPDEEDSIFKKLFGAFQGKGPTLAFVSPDGGVLSDGSSIVPGRYDRYTAVYDISAKTVYMPDGRKLEAHSGLGSRLDDPRFVHERMRGPTPPHLYDLSWREKLFHGVRAIRLNPVGGNGSIYGRTGLLAHTYMLGPNGDSNGCVSFRDYNAFIKAFENGQIKRLAVVAKL